MQLENLEKELEEAEVPKEKPKLEDTEIYRKVVKFTLEVKKHYGDIIKSVLIFGSVVRGDAKKTSDADVLVVLDDTATKTSEDLDKVNSHLYLLAHELKDIHIQTHTLTEFWQWVRSGSPELVNFLRYGLPIYDTGFIKPVQRMLEMGLIPPSEETISLKAKAANIRVKKVKLDIKSMIFELRYAAMDIIQAVVMHYYKAQPDYKDAFTYLEKLKNEKGLEAEYIEKFKELDKLWKDIDHKVIEEATTQHLERALQLTNEIIERFKNLLPKEIIGEEEE
jgi:predicted nucleotidyltransferase